MQNTTVPRYQPTYRHDEIDLVLRLARRGESLAFVGLAGIGKSNLVNYLRDLRKHPPPPELDVLRLHFPVVDATYWQGTPLSLWKIMLDALQQTIRPLAPPLAEPDTPSISEEEQWLDRLRQRFEWLCQQLEHQVMFVLDDFDAVFATGPLAMLERLNGLRSEGNREALSYLIFTKRLPHVLGRSYNLEHESKFYDLFRHHIYALEPYLPDDAFQMLRHLNQLADHPLRDKDLAQIRQFAGGHARLLKIIFDIWVTEDLSGSNPLIHLGERVEVQQECEQVVRSLHEEEQAVAIRIAQGTATPADQDIVDHLVRRGVLAADGKTFFSPLLAQFLSHYQV
jgi:hypothetical protein